MSEKKPIIGVVMGDSAGVGPELVAKLAAQNFYADYCRPLIIGDMRILANALKIVGGEAKYYAVSSVAEADWEKGIPVLDQKDQDPADVKMGELNMMCSVSVNKMLDLAIEMCKTGEIDGFCFGPFNKQGMKLAGCQYESEHHVMAHAFGVADQPFGEINVAAGMWTTRTTSHIPISEVSSALSVEKIFRAITLCHKTLKMAGFENPRIGVAALNPHAGEGGKCGREEIDIIAPAIEKAKEAGMNAMGPDSSDILFHNAFNKKMYDGVVTMFHDQGQIALKLIGFSGGITIAGGQPYPVVTCGHGTAYDIAGKNIVTTDSFANAVKMASQMAANNKKG